MKLFTELRKNIREAKKATVETNKKTDPEKWLENYRKWKELEATLRLQQASILKKEARVKNRKFKDHYKFFLGGVAVKYILLNKENFETIDKETAQTRIKLAGYLLENFLSRPEYKNMTVAEVEALINAKQS